MQIIFSYKSGRRVTAAVLAVGPDYMRVVVPGKRDAFDLRLLGDEWMTEAGKAVRMDAILLADEEGQPSTASGKEGQTTRKKATRSTGGRSA